MFTFEKGSNENTADTKCKAPVTPCVKSVHDVTPNVTGPPAPEPMPTKADGHHPGDGHNHTSVVTPPPHHEGDGHDHSKDGGHKDHDHEAHSDGDHDHYDGDDHDHSKHDHGKPACSAVTPAHCSTYNSTIWQFSN